MSEVVEESCEEPLEESLEELYLVAPYILAAEIWEDWPARTTLYKHVHGSSPEITNHLSLTRFQVVQGSGTIATSDCCTEVASGTTVSIMPGVRYDYEGHFSVLQTIIPALMSNFVTIDNQPLPRAERKILRQILREERRDELRAELAKRLNLQPAIEFMYRSQEFVNQQS